jgi:threonine/homoserine/homoserine lactone efflux protein
MKRVYEFAICFIVAIVCIYVQSLHKLLITVGLAVLIYLSYQLVQRLK